MPARLTIRLEPIVNPARSLALTALCVMPLACSDTADPTELRRPASVTLDAETVISLSADEARSIGVAVRDTAGELLATAPVAWTTNSPEVATVSATGVIQAIGPGNATITATADTASAQVGVQVVRSYETITAGSLSSCAISPTARIYCWGSDAFSSLGTGPGDGSTPVPVEVPASEVWRTVSAFAGHACAVNDDAAGYCWGDNNYGEIGNGTQFTRPETPAAVSGGHLWKTIVAGSSVSCGLTQSDDAYCWGRGTLGRLGNGLNALSTTPSQVIGGHKFSKLALGTALACGLAAGGDAYCWGAGALGSIPAPGGDGSTATPLAVQGGHHFVDLALTFNTGCALTAQGAVWCWGQNGAGELGPGAPDFAATPILLGHLPAFTRLFGGPTHFCGLTAAGEATCWGPGGDGQLGAPATESCGSTPCSRTGVVVAGGHRFVTLATAPAHTCGVTVGGGAWCWGSGGAGQLGDGEGTSSAIPVLVRHPPGG
jgi:alpha-tubulin suppressor-like RCC1 family protein